MSDINLPFERLSWTLPNALVSLEVEPPPLSSPELAFRSCRTTVIPVLTLQMEPSPTRGQMGVIRRRDLGDSSGAARVQMTEAVSQLLQIICAEPNLVVQDMVMGRSRRTQQACVALQIKVKFGWVDNHCVDNRPRRAVAPGVAHAGSHRKEFGMVALLNIDKGQLRIVILIKPLERVLQGCDFLSSHLRELTLAHTIAVEKDPRGVRLVLKNQQKKS